MSELQDLETLKSRFDRLQTKKTQAETLLSSAEQELQRLQAEAMERYGTANLDELRTKLAKIEADNIAKQREYQKHLDDVEAKLREIEANFRENGEA